MGEHGSHNSERPPSVERLVAASPTIVTLLAAVAGATWWLASLMYGVQASIAEVRSTQSRFEGTLMSYQEDRARTVESLAALRTTLDVVRSEVRDLDQRVEEEAPSVRPTRGPAGRRYERVSVGTARAESGE